MSYIIHNPPQAHACAPGWTEDDGTLRRRWGRPGMVVRCPCGRTWLYDSTRERPGYAEGFDSGAWRPERRRERRRRLAALEAAVRKVAGE